MDDMLIKRISVLALIVALLFGALQYIGNKTYEYFGTEIILNVFAKTFFTAIILAVLIYLIFVGINIGYGIENIIPEKYLRFFYNSIVLVSFSMILLIVFFALLVNLITLFPFLTPKIGSYLLIIFSLFWLITFAILFSKYVAINYKKLM